MPYTPAHAIIAAPFWYGSRKKLSLPALVMGCLAPDLPYFVYLKPVPAPGHTWIGLLTHAIPHGLLGLSLWYVWLERPMLKLFGLPISEKRLGWQWGLTMLFSLWLGAVSHALWDATSHQSGWFVERFALLNVMIGPIPIFKWIQYGGGLLGLGAIAGWYWMARKHSDMPRLTLYDRLKAGVVFSLPMLGMVALANRLHQSQGLQEFAVHTATGMMMGAVIGACLYAAIARAGCLRNGFH